MPAKALGDGRVHPDDLRVPDTNWTVSSADPCDLIPAVAQRRESVLLFRPRAGTVVVVSIAFHPDEPVSLTVLPPDEALLCVLPTPTAEDLAIEGLTDEEWDAFEHALSTR